jgi:putative ABC transport system permease protein
MESNLPTIPLSHLLLAFAPSLLLLAIMRRWSLGAGSALYANARMLVQLLGVGYGLRYVFETEQPGVIVGVLAAMVAISAWIALRPLKTRGTSQYSRMLIAVVASGLPILAIITQLVLDLPRWFEPNFVVPLAGMIFANTMNTVSLAAERFESERERGGDFATSRNTALDAALIPQINGLLAVGLVSLPGMMTGQILSGIEPLVAVRYQIMVMCMVFSSGGLGAAVYLSLRSTAADPAPT